MGHNLPKSVLAAIDIACDNIIRMPKDLWDDATALLVEKLRRLAEQEHILNGSKYLADVQEHIDEQQEGSMYYVVKRKERADVIYS